ncbi:hypothetical protein MKW98_015079 [Papaver atlanticum]|uniref:Uncharacterized protein n=1 Tax=Papaver atlanticum TaxID=357466 RepID=A0AAD4S7A9_9MAGN|nr:hypothetical protein MKW98_015079 [Papaver atlanticum]
MFMEKNSTSSSSSSSSCFVTSTRRTLTVWMKSLVFNGNGCTVYDSSGNIVYRIDNYDQKLKNEFYLMDVHGNVLVTILKKKLSVIKFWEGYKSTELEGRINKPWFQVKNPRLFKGDHCEVLLIKDGNNIDLENSYKIAGNATAFKIINEAEELVAEVKQKQSVSGITLGEDVMTLMVEENVDLSFIMSLVVIYCLIHHKM